MDIHIYTHFLLSVEFFFVVKFTLKLFFNDNKLLCVDWWGHIWSIVSSSGLSSTRQIWSYWIESSEGPVRRLRDWSIFPIRHGWDSLDCSAWNREGSGRSHQWI